MWNFRFLTSSPLLLLGTCILSYWHNSAHFHLILKIFQTLSILVNKEQSNTLLINTFSMWKTRAGDKLSKHLKQMQSITVWYLIDCLVFYAGSATIKPYTGSYGFIRETWVIYDISIEWLEKYRWGCWVTPLTLQVEFQKLDCQPKLLIKVITFTDLDAHTTLTKEFSFQKGSQESKVGW